MRPKLIRLFFSWTFVTGVVLAAGPKERIAVVDFEVQGAVGVADAGKIVSRLLLSEFSDRFELVTRTQLQTLLTEKNLQVTDLMEADKAKEYGKLIAVKYLVVGEVMKGAEFWITAQLVEVGPGIIRSPRKISAQTYQELEAKIPLLGQLLSMSDAQYRNWLEAKGNVPKQSLLGGLIAQYPKILEFTSGDWSYATYHGGVVLRDNVTGAKQTVWAGEPGHEILGDFKSSLASDPNLKANLGPALTDAVSVFNDALRVQIFAGGAMIYETKTAITWRSCHERRIPPPK
ncbi:MAG: hypothetical protein HZA91_14565 [Verrucomicrobia bacterium]|nr:hypothetical protein [Verrucomicrobiota bacterium]